MLLAGGLLAASLQAPAAAHNTADPALTAAIVRFFETQEAEDVAGYLSLWSASASRPSPEQLKYIFDSGDDVFSEPIVTSVSSTGQVTRVRVMVDRRRTVPRAGDDPLVTTSTLRVALTFEKHGDAWLLTREGPAADGLAEAVMEADGDAVREALMAAEPDLAGAPLVGSLARLGGAAAVAGAYARAQAIYEQLVRVAQRGGLRKEEGEGLQNVANVLYFQRRFPEALALYEQRLALERAREDEAGIAAAIAGIATIRYSQAEYTEALLRYREALAIHERLDDVAGVATATLSIGNIGFLQGDFHAAIAAYRRSLELHRSMAYADGESRALEGLGRVYAAQGDYAAALDVLETALRDKRMQSYRGRLGAVAQNLGDVHVRLGNLDAARATFAEARAHFEAVRDMPNVGRVMQGSALVDLVAGRFVQAEDHYRRSGTICTAADDGECAARAAAGLAYAQAAQENFWEAAATYRRAIDAFAALGRQEDAARSEVGLSQALVGAGDIAGGIEAAIRARQSAVALPSDDVLWRALTAEARAVRKKGEKDRALGAAQAALRVLDRLEAAALDRPGASLAADTAAALATFAVLQAENGDAAGAFATTERLHRVELRARLATNERDIARGMTSEERDEERRLAAALATRLAQLTREKNLPKPDAGRVADLEKAVTEATAARRNATQRLYERLPELRDLRALGPVRNAADAAAVLTDDRTVLVSFVLEEDDVLVLTAVRRTAGDAAGPAAPPAVTVAAHRSAVGRRDVAALVAGLQQPAILGDVAAWTKAASELVAAIPAPVQDIMRAASHVIVIPHDVLWRVPFEALPIGDAVLADRAAVSLAGSLDSLIRAGGSAIREAQPAVAVGAPDIGPERLERLKRAAPGWMLRSQDLADGELSAVATAAPQGRRVTLLARADATERGVRDALTSAGWLHVAAPFRVNAASPLFSPIMLSGAAAPTPPAEPAASPSRTVTPALEDDGSLELRELINLHSTARVAIFSDGGATAMRDGAAAIDVLQWGWLAAGTPALIVARWHTPRPAAERLIRELSKQLHAGLAPAAALRAAQQAVRSDPATAAPVYWAGWGGIGR